MKYNGHIFIGIGVAVGIALIAYGLSGAQRHPKPAPNTSEKKENIIAVVTTAKPIARGQTITQADLSSARLYNSAPAGVLHLPSEALGRIAKADIPAGQFVLGEQISTDPAAGGLALRVPEGLRAISLLTNEEIAVAGFIQVGDHVDIQTVLRDDVITKGAVRQTSDTSEARTVLHDVEVIAIDDSLSDAAQAKARAAQSPPQRRQSTITLAMSPAQLAKFTLARALGPYFLALRNPKDSGGVFEENRARLIDIRDEARPSPGAPRSAVARRAPAVDRAPIDLVVGGQTQAIYPGAGE